MPRDGRAMGGTPNAKPEWSVKPQSSPRRGFGMERVTGIEPAFSAWEADVLPLNYTRAKREGTKGHPWCSVPIHCRVTSRLVCGP
jgi:hypothetical protein